MDQLDIFILIFSQFGVTKKDPTSTLEMHLSRVAAAAIKGRSDAVHKPQHLVCNGPAGAH